MNEKVNKKDLLIIKLIYYFLVKKNYIPIIIKGIDDEVWLENPKGEYRVVRIVKKNIFNKEQYYFDENKTKNIVSQISRQTLNPFIDVLTIYTDIDNDVENNFNNTRRYKYISIEKEDDIYNNNIFKKNYKDIKDNITFKEDGYNLFNKLIKSISDKNIDNNERYNNMYKERKPVVTFSIILINIIIFILMYLIGNGSEDLNTLIKFGANSSSLIKSGEYYRLITSAFLHIGIIHLTCNMYSLFVIGPPIEHYYGRGKFLIIYLYSAILGNLFAILFQGGSTISAGASGAIFGLLGSLLYFGITYRGYIGNYVLNQIIPLILINLFIGFTSTGISNSAHIGGLIGGFIISMMLGIEEKEKDKAARINGFILTLLITAFMIYMVFFK